MIRHIHLSEVDWIGIKEQLPTGDSEYDENMRAKIWQNFDANDNGLVSLAEVDLALRRMGGPLLIVYYAKSVQQKAFKFAKDLNPGDKDE